MPRLSQYFHFCESRVVCVLFFVLFSFISRAQQEPRYEETSIHLNVAGLGGREVEALIQDEQAFLAVSDVFDYLRIKNTASSELDSVSGFFIEQNMPYLIDRLRGRIVLKDKIYPLETDELIQTSMGLYLKSTVFGKVFDLHCSFDFRGLSMAMSTKLDLPVIRERRQELMRSNLKKFKSEVVADTIVKRAFSLFNFGALDWSVASRQQIAGLSNTQVNLRFGTVLAGGETNFMLDYNSSQDFNMRQQSYLWRHVNNEKKYLRQVLAGKIPAHSTASLMAPVVGLQFSNSPTTYRRSFGTYTISDSTEPDWIVELYVNNVLLDYVKADASGFFSFQVPLVYGNSVVKLRFFGPWGEERSREQTINVPYNFLPKNEFEYRVSAGLVEDNRHSRFSRADVKFGVTQGLTMGAGLEYLSSVNNGNIMPFLNASFKVMPNILLSSDYTHGVRLRNVLTYRLPSNLLVELNYARYQKGQTVINQNFNEERKIMIAKPFRAKGFSGFSRLTFNQIVYPTTQHTLTDLLLSAMVKNVSLNLTTYALASDADFVNMYSTMVVALRLPSRLTLRPQLQYGYTRSKINELKLEVEKQVFGRGFLNLTYDRNFNYNTQGFGLGLRLDLSFARTSFFARQVNNRATFTQSVRGGAFYDGKTNYWSANNRVNNGRAGIVVYPYLDINGNNKRDKNEPKMNGLKLKVNGGRIQTDLRDTTIRIVDLEAYRNYLIELNPNSFDNIAWQLKDTTYSVVTEANKMKLIEIPVKVLGEVSGMVYLNDAGLTGQGRVIINIYRDGTTLAGRTLSESDGYFSFLGLPPGKYTASVDKAQMDRLKMTALPASVSFSIKSMSEGDVADNLEFRLQSDKGN
ncbi:hypothetical protein ACFSJU_12860 [Paradesertivirga mongoliensis]|uniref:Carboxypeptidase regulatory-like domain-containing protein n=1 Tax=Paradesertivirga mongoliensis TaxID=2100740 RepID=A0ABW4ZN25_9SPHI